MQHVLLIFFILFLMESIFAQPQIRKTRILQSSGNPELENSTVFLKIKPKINITRQGEFLMIKGNGIPNHAVGKFPNPGNPHEISSQEYEFQVPIFPKKTGKIIPVGLSLNFGVAINGIPFDPAAAEWFNGEQDSEWRYEALSGAVALGLDDGFAHVQPTGAYHYHGIPRHLLKTLRYSEGLSSPVIGYAADGFKIYAIYGEKGQKMTSSYQLKKGQRSIGGKYDGTFVSDYEYIKGSGSLDECNGAIMNGSYSYFLTEKFPVIPRCLKGTPNASFKKEQNGRNASMHRHTHHSDQSRHRRGAPPLEARAACRGKSAGANCSFQSPRGNITGRCFHPPGSSELACKP